MISETIKNEILDDIKHLQFETCQGCGYQMVVTVEDINAVIEKWTKFLNK